MGTPAAAAVQGENSVVTTKWNEVRLAFAAMRSHHHRSVKRPMKHSRVTFLEHRILRIDL
jgi:hypothetical protein